MRAICSWPKGIVACSILVLCVFAACMPSCTVTTPLGPITVEPAKPAKPGSGHRVIGTFVDENGNVWKLVDTNGDGVPDFVIGPNGRWYRIVPPDEVPSAQIQPVPVSEIPQDTQSMLGRLTRAIANDTLNYQIVQSIVAIGTPAPVNFAGRSAEYWIAYYGLDKLQQNVATTIHGFSVRSFDTATMQADVTIPWTTKFDFPDFLDYEIGYEMYGLFSTHYNNPAVLSIRVVGDASEVAAFMADLGATSYSFTASGTSWTAVLDSVARTATLLDNTGAVVDTISFN